MRWSEPPPGACSRFDMIKIGPAAAMLALGGGRSAWSRWMIMPVRHLLAVVFYGARVCLGSCAAPQATQPVPNDSAAFIPREERWQRDLVHTVAPVYSFADRAAWRQGRGIFHVILDRSTGSVVQVAVKQSTGHATLDASAIQALKQWRFRPGSWDAVNVPVTFKMARTREEYREKVRQHQQQQRQL